MKNKNENTQEKNKTMYTGNYQHDTVLTDAEKVAEASTFILESLKKWLKKKKP